MAKHNGMQILTILWKNFYLVTETWAVWKFASKKKYAMAGKKL